MDVPPSLTNIGTDKLVHARNDHDTFLPNVHLDTPEPVTDPIDSEGLGFSFADEWSKGKRSLNDKHGDRYHEAPHKRDDFHASDDAPPGVSGGLTFEDAKPRKRDLFDPINPASLLNPIDPISLETLPKSSPSDAPPKGWVFVDAPLRKRQDTVTEVVDKRAQPFETAGDSTPDPKYPRPRQGWMFASAPHKRDEAYNPCLAASNDNSLIFKDAPINCGRGLLARMKKAVRSIRL